ncbi:Gfo/Idh/MocA family protein [Fimbriimonas ginsengisoli]|uniref:Oxidoreductase with transcriptional repressor domain n=1 Tax=Fimbriimonas ginsengisoli Gsoil 348 TaxID=661478 RepID=A0A068NM75_FIMGI|nr:Gfo/Idh/MocA family oxidoreductase [Fimbriimonas ginsengisoli]AIE84668.1 oxidoreductase with transcriptional repressor domain [Fimbriimonas ginsengisoli Gsoil 348]
MRIGVIGWGLRKGVAQLAHRPEEGRELVVLADPSEEARRAFHAYSGGETVETVAEMLEKNLDAAFVLSPDWLHEEHAVACLEAGVPIYLEKPMAISVEGCDRVLETSRRTGVKLYVGHNMRQFAVVRKMKEWIDAGRIGEVKAAWCRHFVSYGGEAYFRDWHADRSKSTGLLLQKGAHDIDILHWLCGGFSKRVTAMGALSVYGDIQERQEPGETVKVAFEKTWPPQSLTKLYPVVDVEDVSMMLMELDNGVLASYQHCMFSPDAWRNYTVIGTHGRIENFGDAPGQAVVRLWNQSHHYSPEGDDQYAVPTASGDGHGGADGRTVDEFFRFLQHGCATDATPEAARMAVAAGVAATESLRNGSVPIEVAS